MYKRVKIYWNYKIGFEKHLDVNCVERDVSTEN